MRNDVNPSLWEMGANFHVSTPIMNLTTNRRFEYICFSALLDFRFFFLLY